MAMREGAKLKEAKQLRSNMTQAEWHLWYHLRAKRFHGLKFRRQAPLEGYIPDFICMDPPLIIELDGSTHVSITSHDQCKDEILRKRGFTVLRFWNNEVMNNIEGVLTVILRHVKQAPLPGPLPHAGEGDWQRVAHV